MLIILRQCDSDSDAGRDASPSPAEQPETGCEFRVARTCPASAEYWLSLGMTGAVEFMMGRGTDDGPGVCRSPEMIHPGQVNTNWTPWRAPPGQGPGGAPRAAHASALGALG